MVITSATFNTFIPMGLSEDILLWPLELYCQIRTNLFEYYKCVFEDDE